MVGLSSAARLTLSPNEFCTTAKFFEISPLSPVGAASAPPRPNCRLMAATLTYPPCSSNLPGTTRALLLAPEFADDALLGRRHRTRLRGCFVFESVQMKKPVDDVEADLIKQRTTEEPRVP